MYRTTRSARPKANRLRKQNLEQEQERRQVQNLLVCRRSACKIIKRQQCVNGFSYSVATAEASPGKGDKPTEGQKTEVPKTEQQPASNDQAAQAPFKQPFAPTPFAYFGQPQYYGQVPYQQAVYDPSKLNAANNGAVSSFLFSRNQPQPAYQQPQPVMKNNRVQPTFHKITFNSTLKHKLQSYTSFYIQ